MKSLKLLAAGLMLSASTVSMSLADTITMLDNGRAA